MSQDKRVQLVRIGGPDDAPTQARRLTSSTPATPPTLGAMMEWILRYASDLRVVNHGPLAMPAQQYEVTTLVGGEYLHTYGASPNEAIANFGRLIAGRLSVR